jgi:F0F1-type ATP synthase assembly protein I
MGTVIALGSELGFLIALPLVICILIGVVVDRKLDTFPLWLLVSVFLGIGLTVVNIYKIIIPFLEKRSGDNKK